MRATGIFTLFSVRCLVVIPLLMALLLNRKFPGRTFFRAVFFTPYVLGVAVIGVLFRFMLDPNIGVLNYYLDRLRGASPGPPQLPWAWVSLVGMTVWWTLGFNAIIYLAGLQDISPELYEAAEMDGATSWEKFRNVTLPGLRPVMLFVTDPDHPGLGQHVRSVLPDDQGRARQRHPYGDLLHRPRSAAQLPAGRRGGDELRPRDRAGADQPAQLPPVPREGGCMMSRDRRCHAAADRPAAGPRGIAAGGPARR